MDSSKKRTEKGNLYDRIFKENAESLFIPLIEEELSIKILSYKPIPTKLSRTIEREMDFFYEIVTEEDGKMLLHIEFQTEDDKQMIYRMSEYHGIAFRKYKLPIRHVVIYLGEGKAKMRTELKGEEVFDGFDLINIHQLNTTQLLSSQVPEVVLLALLSSYEPDRAEAILRLIVMQLKAVCSSEQELRKYVKQLQILARLRKLSKVTNEIISSMPVLYDIEQDELYQEGMEKGMENGMEKGMLKAVLTALKNGLSYDAITRFSELTVEEIAKIDEKRKNGEYDDWWDEDEKK